MNKEEIEKLTEQYFDIEEKILSEIQELPNYNKECECDDPSKFCIVDDDTIQCYCINCGGDIYC